MRNVKYFNYDFYNEVLKYGIPLETEKELVDFANEFLNNYFGLKLNIPIKYNGRLKNAVGRLVVDRKTEKPRCIELNKKSAVNAYLVKDLTTIKNALKHELCHYALCVMNKPYFDGEDYFEKTLIRTDSPSSYAVYKRTENKNFIKDISYSTIYIDEETNKKYFDGGRKTKLKTFANNKFKYIYAESVKLVWDN